MNPPNSHAPKKTWVKRANQLGTLFLVFATLLWAMGLPIGLPVNVAQAVTASNVVGADADTTGYGLDGRDFQITWTMGPLPTGYVESRLFILPNTTEVAANTITVNACGGQACQPRGFFPQTQSAMSLTLPTMSASDSGGTPWNAGTQYKACVFIDATTDELTCSSAFSVTSESSDDVADSNPPMIDHMSVHAATAAVDAVFYASVYDDQTTAAEFAVSPAYIKLVYGINAGTVTNEVTAQNETGDLFKFTIASGSVPAQGSTIKYYLTARDKTPGTPGNVRFFCANPSANTAVACAAAPFIVTINAAGERTVSGTINQNVSGVTSALASAKVFAGGFAKIAVTTAENGTYTISGLPNNDSLDITAYKQSYCKMMRFETIGTSNLANVNINLNFGTCGFSSGGPGGDITPHVTFSAPPDGSNQFPLADKIRIGLNASMNSLTINDTNAADAGSNIYLTTDDGTTKVAGAALWCPFQSSVGCSSLSSTDTNTILFSPTSALTANTFYSLIISEAVTSDSGQSIQGNRPGGGHRISFTTSGATMNQQNVIDNFGSGGQYLPPYVRSTVPAPGISIRPNTKLLIEFNEAMNTSSLTTTNIKLVRLPSTDVTIQTSQIAIDNNESRFVTITPLEAGWTAGDYEVRVLGAVANARGMTMRPPADATQIAFRNNFNVSGSSDSAAPTIYPMLANNTSSVAVNGALQFGFNEQLNFNTVNSTNITLKRGTTTVSAEVIYDPSDNSVSVIPNDELAPNTAYTVMFSTSVADLSSNGLASAAAYSYTTGSADTATPTIREARCDDYRCTIFFTEPMNHDTQADSAYANSVLKQANWTIERTSPDTQTLTISNTPFTYDGKNRSVTVEGVTGLAASNGFRITASTNIMDLSGNAISSAGNANVFNGRTENSQATFGSFGDQGMFGPPISGAGCLDTTSNAAVTFGTSEFKPEGFGSFTASQFAFGQADMAYPFNPMASQDSNVFQVRFNPGQALQDDDLIILTFPTGTTIASAVPDTYSPYYTDLNEANGAGTVAFDSTYDTDGVAVDSTARTVTVKLAVSGGTPGANDSYVLDLRKITNPAIPKGPETGGYTIGIKVSRAGQILANKTSMPYFIQAGGTNSITVKVYAGTAGTGTAGATGDAHMWGGGPSGPMDKLVTLTDGITTAADGTAIAGDAGIVYSNLPDGCYNFGTEPFVTLGASNYFGQMSPEPVCVNTSTPAVTKNIVLSAASGAGTVDLTIKLAGIADFGGTNIDIFAGGPGRYVNRTLSNVGVPAEAGYTITLNANGPWNIGVGPSMPKGVSSSMPKALPGIAPPPTDIIVSELPSTGTIATGFRTPPGVSVNTTTKTITFTFAAADKAISGTVTDGTDGLANVNVFMHAQGFGQPAFTSTKSDGTFSLSVSDYGSYEIGVMKDGLPPSMNNIEIRPDGADAGTDPDVFYKGKQITGANPLVIKLKKASYTISGKVLDANSNGIAYAPIFATDAYGTLVNSGTSSDGSYTIFVDTGTWTVKSMLPPDKTDACGTLEKTVTISTESKANQNISLSTGTCYTISGTVTVAGSNLSNVPIFVDEWDSTNSRPVAGGTFKPASTDSNGLYTVKVKGNATYRIGTWDSTYGELSTTQTVTTADISNAHITSGTTGTVTLAFTNGSVSHEAFIELKKSNDQFTRVSKTQKGLTNNVTFTLKEGTYNYFVDVFGVGKYSGTVATGATATINLTGGSLVTLSGNVKDNASTPANVTGALVALKSSDGTATTTTTDSDGNYSVQVKAGTYTVSSSKAQHIPGQTPTTLELTATTANYDFGGTTPDQAALKKSDQIISGTVYQSNGSTAVTSGFVTATDANGISVSAPVDPVTGLYTLPVDDGTWTVKAVAPLHSKTTLASDVVTAGTTDQTNKNITLTSDATKSSSSKSASLSATTGGSVNDTQNTGVKLTVGQGVLETGDTTVSLNMEKNFTAPDTNTFKPLGDATFAITAQNSESSSSIKDLKGNAEIQINYAELLSSLPSGVSESDLKLAYYSTEKDAYVPVEGGFTVDPNNDTITGQVNHFTNFSIIYAPLTASSGRRILPTTPAPSPAPAVAPATPVVIPVTVTPTPTTTEKTPTTTPTLLALAPITTTPQAAPVATLIKDPSKLETILSTLNLVAKPQEAAKYQPLIKSDAIAFKVKLNETQESAITNFVTYGISKKTQALGSGERRAVMRDYMETVGKSDVNWEDVERITIGEKPVARNLAKEQAKVGTVLKTFVKITGHTPNFKDADEDLAWNTMMYRIRFTRDLTKEKAGIAEFKKIFKKTPSAPIDWSAVRALGYVLD